MHYTAYGAVFKWGNLCSKCTNLRVGDSDETIGSAEKLNNHSMIWSSKIMLLHSELPKSAS